MAVDGQCREAYSDPHVHAPPWTNSTMWKKVLFEIRDVDMFRKCSANLECTETPFRRPGINRAKHAQRGNEIAEQRKVPNSGSPEEIKSTLILQEIGRKICGVSVWKRWWSDLVSVGGIVKETWPEVLPRPKKCISISATNHRLPTLKPELKQLHLLEPSRRLWVTQKAGKRLHWCKLYAGR